MNETKNMNENAGGNFSRQSERATCIVARFPTSSLFKRGLRACGHRKVCTSAPSMHCHCRRPPRNDSSIPCIYSCSLHLYLGRQTRATTPSALPIGKIIIIPPSSSPGGPLAPRLRFPPIEPKEVRPSRLHQAAQVRRGWKQEAGVLRTPRQGRHGGRVQQEMRLPGVHQGAVVRRGRQQEAGVLRAARFRRDGERLQQVSFACGCGAALYRRAGG